MHFLSCHSKPLKSYKRGLRIHMFAATKRTQLF
jgi:hypothetical protein